jgi:diketogulonate reductase-like aldo/keto reductase
MIQTVSVQGVEVPAFLYGTAWKEDRTEALVGEALAAGFRGIDTANQRRHYHEAGVGAAIRKAVGQGGIARDALFLQTKFTYVEGQDARLPYDPASDYPTQVRQSFDSSLQHLGVDRIDSYLLHGPRTGAGLSGGDRNVWRTMEELQGEGRVRLIGVSNVTADQLSMLCQTARVRPAFVQNRCYARLGWDRAVREVCRREGVTYQGFSLLTANVAELGSPELGRIAIRHRTSRTRVVFRFAIQIGMVCLTGTTNPEHMRDDLAAFDLELSEQEVETIETISG